MDKEDEMERVIVLVAAFIVMFATGASAVNWEIVSIEKRCVRSKPEYIMQLKDPHSVMNVRTLSFTEAQMREIKTYFNVANTREMLGYQFISDKRHEGVIKEINALE
jgi:hypothetical protein